MGRRYRRGGPGREELSDSILVVEDERSIRTIVEYALRDAGFRVLTAARGDDALDVVASEPVDLVVLDIMLPGPGRPRGVQAHPGRAQHPDHHAVGAGEELDNPRARAGADDYVTKPFSPRELVSRVNANRGGAYRAGPWSRGPRGRPRDRRDGAHGASRRRGDIASPTLSSRSSTKLAGSPRRVFTREELMNHLWKGNFYGDLRSVDVHVRHLRQKVEVEPSEPVLIRTVRGVGCAFGGEDGRAP